jgi:hypothetical protein
MSDGYGTCSWTCGQCGETYSASGVVGDLRVASWFHHPARSRCAACPACPACSFGRADGSRLAAEFRAAGRFSRFGARTRLRVSGTVWSHPGFIGEAMRP